MGKRLIQQARGKGGPRYRAPSFRYKGKLGLLKESKELVKGKVMDIVKCPGHSTPLIKVKYENNETVLMPAPEGIRVNEAVEAGPNAQPKVGNVLPLSQIPEGTFIYNIESNPGDGGRFCRASGTFARVLTKMRDKVLVQLPSKKEKLFRAECRACIGILAGSGRKEKPFVKAGNKYKAMKARNKLYPIVSGVSMNAVDHPFGSGRGSHKGKPTIARRFAPPGAKVGMLRPKRAGRKKR